MADTLLTALVMVERGDESKIMSLIQARQLSNDDSELLTQHCSYWLVLLL